MALQVSLSIVAPCAPVCPDPNVVYPESYARILFIRADSQASYPLVAWYADKAAREAGDAPVQVREYLVATVDLVGDIYPAAYGWLKTLPEFEGAVDC